MRRLGLVVLALLVPVAGCGKDDSLVPGDGTDELGSPGTRDSGANDVVTLGDGAVISMSDASVADGGAQDAGGDAGCVRRDETCNELDDDCDDRVDEGFPVGDACDGPDMDTCAQGLWSCDAAGELRCSEGMSQIAPEICDSLDNDCDDAVDEGFGVDEACDGTDGDLCEDGLSVCNATHDGTRCDDDSEEKLDLCNGRDDDCDPDSDDGTEDTRVGDGCDGNDSDSCAEGTYTCATSGLVCSDNTGDVPDLCNGDDDDCNPGTADGSGDPSIGQPCDGADSDRCAEGTLECTASGPACDDDTGSTLDTCDGTNDDCDATSPDGSEDPNLNSGCDGDDADYCAEGSYSRCEGGGLVCDDLSGDNAETCNAADDDCDDATDERGRGTFPECAATTVNLGTISGDSGAQVVTQVGTDDAWFLVHISENSTGPPSTSTYLSASINLASPATADFDLYVYCFGCTGDEAGRGTLGTGQTDSVHVRREDTASDDGFDILILVEEYLSTICAPQWTLTINANTVANTATCF